MRVLLRHSGVGLYYAGRKHWVGEQGAALDLGTIERATELSREEAFAEMEIVATYDEPDCELVLPLKPKRGLKELAVSVAEGAAVPAGTESR